MSVKVSLHIDGIIVNVLTYDFTYNQEMDADNRPSGLAKFEGITIKIESQKAVHLAEWAIAHNQTKQLQLIISPVTQTGKTRILHLFDCHLVGWYNHFSSIGTSPKTETLQITCGGVRENSDTLEYSAPWRTTFDVPPPEEKEEEEPTPLVTDWYLTNERYEKIEKAEYEDWIYLVIKTENLIGETLNISLDNPEVDFMYDNERLENDTLSGYTINSNTERVKLQVVKQVTN